MYLVPPNKRYRGDETVLTYLALLCLALPCHAMTLDPFAVDYLAAVPIQPEKEKENWRFPTYSLFPTYNSLPTYLPRYLPTCILRTRPNKHTIY